VVRQLKVRHPRKIRSLREPEYVFTSREREPVPRTPSATSQKKTCSLKRGRPAVIKRPFSVLLGLLRNSWCKPGQSLQGERCKGAGVGSESTEVTTEGKTQKPESIWLDQDWDENTECGPGGGGKPNKPQNLARYGCGSTGGEMLRWGVRKLCLGEGSLPFSSWIDLSVVREKQPIATGGGLFIGWTFSVKVEVCRLVCMGVG